MKWIDYTALTLAIIGAITWGLIGIFQFNLVSFFLEKIAGFPVLSMTLSACPVYIYLPYLVESDATCNRTLSFFYILLKGSIEVKICVNKFFYSFFTASFLFVILISEGI